MECVATALDPVDDNTHSSDKDSQQDNDTTHGHNPLAADNNLAMANLGQNQSSEPGLHAHDGLTNNPSPPEAKHLHHNANMPTYWIAPLNEMMPSTDPLTPISRLRTQDRSTLLHVLLMTQRLSNKTILAIFL